VIRLISQETYHVPQNWWGVRSVPSYSCPVDWLKIKPELFTVDSAGFLLDIDYFRALLGKELEQKLIL